MAKNKKAKHARLASSRGAGNTAKKQPKNLPSPAQPKRKHHQPSQSAPYVPFAETRSSHILLVGEGDFSFARSLVREHPSRWARLCATCYDDQEACYQKYPQAADAVSEIQAIGAEVRFGVDARALSNDKATRIGTAKDKESRAGGWDWVVFNFPHVGGLSKDQRRQVRANQEMLVGFFASAREVLRQPGQARSTGDDHAQEHVAQEDGSDRWHTSDEDEWDDAEPTENRAEQKERERLGLLEKQELQAGGRILLTLFEGLPYSLWNVRDLARHAGFVVERSFKFQAAAYPGYAHARTLGNLRRRDHDATCEGDDTKDGNGKPVTLEEETNEENNDSEDSVERQAREAAGLDRSEVKQRLAQAVPSLAAEQASRPGAWRGEERAARSYVFALPATNKKQTKQTSKRKRSDVDSGSDSD